MALAVRRLLPLLLLAALALGACGGGPSGPQPVSGEMEELLAEVAEVRGLEAPLDLRIGTVTPDNVAGVYLGESTELQETVYRKWTRLYQLLGFLTGDQHMGEIERSLTSNYAGFYSFEGILWIVTEEHGVAPKDFSPYERETVVHEMIHAIQDHHFSLSAKYQNLGWNLDGYLAFTAVIEGDAEVHTARITGNAEPTMAGTGYDFLDGPNWITDVPPAIAREFAFPYVAGVAWAREVLATQGLEGLNSYLNRPPSTSLILHPELVELGWRPDRVSTLDFPGLRASLLPLGLRASALGSLGEFLLLNYLLGNAPAPSDWRQDAWTQTAIEAAAGWSGDFYFLYEGIAQRVLVARVRFVSEEDAREFAEAQRAVATEGADVVQEGILTLATGENGVTVLLEPVGRDVIFAIGSNAEVARAAVEPLLEG